MMNLWTFVQFCSQRAYYGKYATLNPPIPQSRNDFLYIVGMVANISGPLLALFDHTVVNPTPDEKIAQDIH